MNDETNQSPEAAKDAPVNSVARDASMVRVIARILSGRALGAAQAAMVFAITCWAMAQPTVLRAAIAGGFAVFMLLLGVLRTFDER